MKTLSNNADGKTRQAERLLLVVVYLSIASIAVMTFFFLQNTPLTRFHEGCIIGSFFTIALLLPMNFYLLREQLHKTAIQEALEKMQEKYSRAVASTRDGIFELDLKNNTRYWSPRLKEMMGYSESEIDLSKDDIEHYIHPDDLAARNRDLDDHFSGRTPEFSTMFRWRHRDGHWVWIHGRGKATFDGHGHPVTLAGICTDITTLKAYENQLDEARKTAEKENQAKSEFLAHMSHELRTPLTAITGAAEILYGRKAQFDEKTGRLLGALNSSAQSMRDLLGGILDFSKIESGQMKLEKRAFAVAEVFEGIVEGMILRAEEKGLRFECDYREVQSLVLVSDRIRFKQVITNLVGNAIKFTERGGVQVKATAYEKDGKNNLIVTIHDTGIGIRAQDLDSIFKRYVQADSSISRKYGGTGLGLPIAKQLTLLMGGQIDVKSTYGDGSVFTVVFPISADQVAIVPERSDIDQTIISLSPFPKQQQEAFAQLRQNSTILIVEDYEGTITIISEMLDAIGFKYDVAKTGLEALNKWNQNAYKVILMDIQLPEMDGLTAMTQIRNIERERNQSRTPVIAMTAHAFSEDKSKYLEAGFDAYIPKPISKDDLIAKIFSSLRAVEESVSAQG